MLTFITGARGISMRSVSRTASYPERWSQYILTREESSALLGFDLWPFQQQQWPAGPGVRTPFLSRSSRDLRRSLRLFGVDLRIAVCALKIRSAAPAHSVRGNRAATSRYPVV